MKKMKLFRWRIIPVFLLLIMGALAGCDYLDTTIVMESSLSSQSSQNTAQHGVQDEELYSSKEEVAEYLCRYDKLPSNYLTKKEAEELGWENSKGNLWEVTNEMSIGGDRFGNREGLLPTKKGRIYYEADINFQGGYRNAERIVFSNDGLIFYTNDHYGSFKQLYIEEDVECNEPY